VEIRLVRDEASKVPQELRGFAVSDVIECEELIRTLLFRGGQPF
jgi:hypothetical protein